MESLLAGGIGTLTASSIATFLGKTIATKVIGVAAAKIFEKIFEDGKQSEIRDTVQRMEHDLAEITKMLSRVSVEIKWEHLKTRLNDAENVLLNWFRNLMLLLLIEDGAERKKQLETLETAILDPTQGVISKLAVIHRVLVETSVFDPLEEGLLTIWIKEMNKSLKQHPMSAHAYQNCVNNYFERIAILQYKGFILFDTACSNLEIWSKQVKWIQGNINIQIEIVENLWPAAMKYVTTTPAEMIRVTNTPAAIGNLDNPLQQQHTVGTFSLKAVQGEIPFVVEHGQLTVVQTYTSAVFFPVRKFVQQRFGMNDTWFFETKTGNDSDLERPVYIRKVHKDTLLGSREHPYICVKDDKLCSAGLKNDAEPFYVMPLITTDKTLKVIICRVNSRSDKRFLGINPSTDFVDFVDKQGNIEFEMIAVETSQPTWFHSFFNVTERTENK